MSLNLDISVLNRSLTPLQKLAIKNSLLKIKIQENLDDIRFWGKIFGTQSDYYIAISTKLGTSITKSFYWSNDEGVTFSHLPAIDAFIAHKAPLISALLTGNPSLKYKDPESVPQLDEDGNPISDDEEEEEEEQEEQEDEDGNPIPKKIPPRKLTELEKLSYNISDIEQNTGVVPQGAFSLSATGNVQRNVHFKGISAEQAKIIDSFVHLRSPVNIDTLARIRKQGIRDITDCWDKVGVGEKVKNIWSLHVSDSGLSASLRSLLYPGYEFHVEVANNQFAGGYFGMGEKNKDLLFML